MRKREYAVQLILVGSFLVGLTGAVPAMGAISTYAGSCLVCHADQPGISKSHHLLVKSLGMNCLDCHATIMDPATKLYTLQYRDEVCFLRCHAPTLAKMDGPFVRVIPGSAEDNLDYFPALQSNVKRKMATAHHNNYGAPEANTLCGRCHAMVWNPAISAWVTAPVAKSAGMAGNVDNLAVVLNPDQLVYDARPGETIFLSAGLSQGSNLSFTWLLHVGSTAAAALPLGTGPDLVYAISIWTDPNTTNFIELQLKDGVGRFQSKYIAVNIHE